MASFHYLYEQDGLDGGGLAVTRRYGEKGYNHPSAAGYYDGRLQTAAVFRRSVWADGSMGGRSEADYGVAVLLNGDGGADDLLDLAIDGQPFRLYLIEDGQPIDTAVLVLSGIAEQVVPAGEDGDELHVYLYDRQAVFDTALQTRLLGGGNVGPDGVDGGADQEGDPQPIAYGPIFNAEPLLVNEAKNIRQIADGRILGNIVLKDGGSPIDAGVEYATVAALEAAATAGGSFDYCLGVEDAEGTHIEGAYVRTATAPAHDLTVDFDGLTRFGAFLVTTADIIRDIAVWRVGLAGADIHEADFTALNAVQPAALRLWIDDDRDASDALDDLCRSVGAWWGFDRFNRLRLQRVEDPTGKEAALTIRPFGLGAATTQMDACLVAVDGLRADTVGWGPIPAHTVKLAFDHNPTEQDSGDLAGTDVPGEPDPVGGAAMRERLASEWRYVTPADTAAADAIKARHKLSDILEAETLLVAEADARSEVERRALMHGTVQRRWLAEIDLDQAAAELLELGAVARMVHDRHGWEGGVPMVITGLEYDLREGAAFVELLEFRP